MMFCLNMRKNFFTVKMIKHSEQVVQSCSSTLLPDNSQKLSAQDLGNLLYGTLLDQGSWTR